MAKVAEGASLMTELHNDVTLKRLTAEWIRLLTPNCRWVVSKIAVAVQNPLPWVYAELGVLALTAAPKIICDVSGQYEYRPGHGHMVVGHTGTGKSNKDRQANGTYNCYEKMLHDEHMIALWRSRGISLEAIHKIVSSAATLEALEVELCELSGGRGSFEEGKLVVKTTEIYTWVTRLNVKSIAEGMGKMIVLTDGNKYAKCFKTQGSLCTDDARLLIAGDIQPGCLLQMISDGQSQNGAMRFQLEFQKSYPSDALMGSVWSSIDPVTFARDGLIPLMEASRLFVEENGKISVIQKLYLGFKSDVKVDIAREIIRKYARLPYTVKFQNEANKTVESMVFEWGIREKKEDCYDFVKMLYDNGLAGVVSDTPTARSRFYSFTIKASEQASVLRNKGCFNLAAAYSKAGSLALDEITKVHCLNFVCESILYLRNLYFVVTCDKNKANGIDTFTRKKSSEQLVAKKDFKLFESALDKIRTEEKEFNMNWFGKDGKKSMHLFGTSDPLSIPGPVPPCAVRLYPYGRTTPFVNDDVITDINRVCSETIVDTSQWPQIRDEEEKMNDDTLMGREWFQSYVKNPIDSKTITAEPIFTTEFTLQETEVGIKRTELQIMQWKILSDYIGQKNETDVVTPKRKGRPRSSAKSKISNKSANHSIAINRHQPNFSVDLKYLSLEEDLDAGYVTEVLLLTYKGDKLQILNSTLSKSMNAVYKILGMTAVSCIRRHVGWQLRVLEAKGLLEITDRGLIQDCKGSVRTSAQNPIAGCKIVPVLGFEEKIAECGMDTEGVMVVYHQIVPELTSLEKKLSEYDISLHQYSPTIKKWLESKCSMSTIYETNESYFRAKQRNGYSDDSITTQLAQNERPLSQAPSVMREIGVEHGMPLFNTDIDHELRFEPTQTQQHNVDAYSNIVHFESEESDDEDTLVKDQTEKPKFRTRKRKRRGRAQKRKPIMTPPRPSPPTTSTSSSSYVRPPVKRLGKRQKRSPVTSQVSEQFNEPVAAKRPLKKPRLKFLQK